MIDETFYYYSGAVPEQEPFTLVSSGTVTCDGSYGYSRKSYPYHVFEYILGGAGTVKLGGLCCRPVKDHVYFLKRRLPHEYYSDAENPWKKIWFTVSGGLADHLLQAYQLDNLCCVYAPGLSRYFYSIQQLLIDDAPDLQKRAALLFHELILEIARINFLPAQVHAQTALQVKRYLDTHLEQPFHMQDLCPLVYKSVSQITRIFKQAFGMTPHMYLLDRRISAAKLYLLNTELSVKEIASRLQYTDEHHLSASFKKRTGMPPTAFRRHF